LRSDSRTLLMKDGQFREAAPPASLPDGTARIICQSSKGDAWIGADGQIYWIHNGKLELVAGQSSGVFNLLEDHKGQIWAATQSGLFCFSEGRVRCLTTQGRFMARIQDRWSTEIIPPPQNSPRNYTALLEDKNGDIWVGSEIGLWKFKDGRLQRDQETQGTENLRVSALLRDRDGGFWMGSLGSGLYRLSEGRWSRYTSLDGLSDDSVLSLLEDQEGSLWGRILVCLHRRFGNHANPRPAI
jgi:ligand-binding sensor domain-containing protein